MLVWERDGLIDGIGAGRDLGFSGFTIDSRFILNHACHFSCMTMMNIIHTTTNISGFSPFHPSMFYQNRDFFDFVAIVFSALRS
jgi:hypothetical protein